ncbi:solute carrier family 25 member 45-like isoform X2 [Daktulosphaira vitifoliae]|uniref:solute carrier family 25 member 45-like isoform X2 n=1 Tax=Daktulosphaira vitifoliae TaxID=58002 RepID=UPI0021A9E59C|nr:solute carrier family 25 member 45-like isoform X2 [Daktulosphaira vitifoliae]
METIRVVQQVKNVSPLPAFREIYRKHGIPGFYRGMMFPVLSSGIVNSVVFGVNGNTMRFIQTNFREDITENDRSVRFCCNAESLHKYWHVDCFLSGCVAGVFSTLINIPVELVKTVLQASNISLFVTPDKKMGRNNPTRLIQEIYKKNGIRGLYRGGFVLLLRDVPSTGIYILSYEHICSLLRNYSDEKRKNDTFPWQIQLFAGGMAGIACWASVLPFDVIKTQRMLDSVDNPQCKSFWYCTKMIYKNGGIARFYQGFWVLSTRAFLVNSVAFFVYEFLLKACSNFNKMPSTSTHLTSLTIKTDDKYSKWN